MIKPIETRYKGYRFRSRLEARWAVFFDALGVKWEYETEGYDLGAAGWYLPDFKMEDFGTPLFFEVKATEPTAQEREKCRALAMGHEEPYTTCIIGYGDLWPGGVRFDVFTGGEVPANIARNGIVTMNGSLGIDMEVSPLASNDKDIDCLTWSGNVRIHGTLGARTLSFDERKRMGKERERVESVSWGMGLIPIADFGCTNFAYFNERNPVDHLQEAASKINTAFAAARAARFEHGEEG